MAALALALRRPNLFFRPRLSSQTAKDAPEDNIQTADSNNGDKLQQPPRLVSFAQLPQWYRDNPHILSSYRPVSYSYHACFHSLTYLHNETANIYTHLLPALLLALALPTLQLHISQSLADAPWTDRFMLTLTPMAALLTLSLSATYHTLMNHSHAVSSSCLLLDYTGILALILASFVSGVYVGFYNSPFHQRMYWGMILLLVLVSCLLVLHPRLQGPVYRPHRTAAFILTALSGLAPVVNGMYFYGVTTAVHEMGVKWWMAEGLWYGLGAMFFAKRLPESLPWAKRSCRVGSVRKYGNGTANGNENENGNGNGKEEGVFDVWGSSHQIFHCCVVAGAACHCWGVWSAWQNAVQGTV